MDISNEYKDKLFECSFKKYKADQEKAIQKKIFST